MKKIGLIVGMLFLIVSNSYAGHGVERGMVEIKDQGKLESIISKFLSKHLRSCALGIQNESFTVESVKVENVRVDQGIIDTYYTIDLSYDAFRNDVISNDITVKVLDSDFDNWRDYEEKLSSEISFDRNGLCK